MNLKSAPMTILLGAVALLALAALGWIGLIGPALGDLGETGEARTAAQDRNHKMRLDLTRLRAQAEDLPASDALAAELDTMFPPTADQPGFFAQLADITDAAGIPPRDVVALSPGVPTVPGDPAAAGAPVPVDQTGGAGGETESAETVSVADVAVQDVEVQVTGDYAALTEVLQGIERMPRAFLLDTVSLLEDEENGLSLSITGRTFVAPPLQPASGP
jgi:hypothetical protein